MSYRLLYHPEVRERDIPKLDARAKYRVRSAIEQRLVEHPEQYSVPLRKSLKGYRKLRVGDYRVVLRIDDDTVTILTVCHRKDVYRQVERRVR